MTKSRIRTDFGAHTSGTGASRVQPAGENGEFGDNGHFPVVDWDAIATGAAGGGPRFEQPAILPERSILQDWFNYAREQQESANCFLAGAILPIAGAILARLVWFPWGDSRQ
jgi:hypothetical protein